VTSLYLLGGGGHARVVYDALRRAGIAVSAVVDPRKPDDRFEDVPILRSLPATGSFFVTVGQVRAEGSRERIWNEALASGLTAADAFAEDKGPGPRADVGLGTVILAGAYVGVGTKIGANCIVNHMALVEHDCVISDHAHISPRAVIGGSVRVGRRSHIGMGAVIRQGVSIGDDVTVGAGAVVVDDVPASATVVGVPARPLVRT
jgi:sugar O-acyltransferase (sialic acid O-acetyltransferase NeuD family)